MNNTVATKGAEKLEHAMVDAVYNYIGHITDSYADWNLMHATDDVKDFRKKMIADWTANVHYKVGNKYIGIWTGTSIHSFIVNTTYDKKFDYGDVLKPATWKTPTRNFSRGNIFKNGSWAGIAWFAVD